MHENSSSHWGEMRKTTGLENVIQVDYDSLNNIPEILKSYEGERTEHALIEILSNKEVNLNEAIECAMRVQGYEHKLDNITDDSPLKSFVDHTKSVFENFTKYEDKIPEQLLAPMRLLLLAHDIGKPRAAEKIEEFSGDYELEILERPKEDRGNGEVKSKFDKRIQRRYNTAYADHLLSNIGLDPNAKQILLAIVDEGFDIAQDISKGSVNNDALYKFAELTLQQLVKDGEPMNGQVEGLMSMCALLAASDNHCIY